MYFILYCNNLVAFVMDEYCIFCEVEIQILDILASLQSACYLLSACRSVRTHEDIENGWKDFYESFYCRLHFAAFLFGLLFDMEDGGDIFLRNVVLFFSNYTALQPRTAYSS
jgi:hypothetical protein